MQREMSCNVVNFYWEKLWVHYFTQFHTLYGLIRTDLQKTQKIFTRLTGKTNSTNYANRDVGRIKVIILLVHENKQTVLFLILVTVCIQGVNKVLV